MKKITVKVITISSQLLVTTMFLLNYFNATIDTNNKNITIKNNNFDKMAEMTTILFKEEETNTKEENTGIVSSFVEEVIENTEEVKEEVSVENVEVPDPAPVSLETSVLQTVVGNLTGYGANCYGCSGVTASGFDLRQSIYYDDSDYGAIRILAADPSFPMYSIFRISGVPGMEPFIGIVLDRGGNVGFGRGTLFDLAYMDENDPNLISLTHNVTFELLRSGR